MALIAEIGTAFIPGPGGIEGAVMGEDFEGNHLEFMEDIDEDMKNLIIELFAQTYAKIRESGFTGDTVIGDTGIGAIGPTPVLIPKE